MVAQIAAVACMQVAGRRRSIARSEKRRSIARSEKRRRVGRSEKRRVEPSFKKEFVPFARHWARDWRALALTQAPKRICGLNVISD